MRKPPLRTVGLLAAVLCAATPAFAQLMPKVEFDEAVRRARALLAHDRCAGKG